MENLPLYVSWGANIIMFLAGLSIIRSGRKHQKFLEDSNQLLIEMLKKSNEAMKQAVDQFKKIQDEIKK